MSIYVKLIEVQSELKAPKGQYNSFGKYSYRKADDILEAVKPLLKEKGLAIVLSDKAISLGQKSSTRNQNTIQGAGEKTPSFDKSVTTEAVSYEVVIEATAILIDQEGNTIEATAQAGVEPAGGMQLPQAYGSASSYARKYAMSGLFAIDDENDADSGNTHGKPSPAKPTAKPAAKAPAKAKPELTPTHKNWNKAVKHVAGGGDIDVDICGAYSLSDSNRQKLVKAAEAANK